jgi:hypothetical protein
MHSRDSLHLPENIPIRIGFKVPVSDHIKQICLQWNQQIYMFGIQRNKVSRFSSFEKLILADPTPILSVKVGEEPCKAASWNLHNGSSCIATVGIDRGLVVFDTRCLTSINIAQSKAVTCLLLIFYYVIWTNLLLKFNN